MGAKEPRGISYLNERVESAFSSVEGKAEAVIFPRNLASSTRNFSLKMMASISAVGSLPKHFPANPSAVNPLPPPVSIRHMECRSRSDSSSSSDGSLEHTQRHLIDRRQMVISSLGLLASTVFNSQTAESSIASEFADMPALRGKDYGKTKMRYPDYTETNSGLQYKDLRVGAGPIPKIGETVVVDWDGFTIGYYGRIFEARNKTKGGSFVGDDKDFFMFRLGSREVIPAFEEAVSGMALGGIRRIVVPPELGYPENDFNKKGPRPTTFSGQRALDFVLRNQGLIDKTLLFDIELIKIIPNGNS